MKIYIIWLIGGILWNFGYPSAKPTEDVIAEAEKLYEFIQKK